MKKLINLPLYIVALILFGAILFGQGCKKDDMQNQTNAGNLASSPAADKKVVKDQDNLVSDVNEYSPEHIDTNLVNAWGLAFGPTGGIWVSSNEKGLSTIYDIKGNTLIPPASIGFGGNPNGSNPTGQVFNPTSAFIIPASGKVSKFIFATENGTIAAWGGGDSATTVADRSGSDAVYKGIELASSNGSWFLYATDFHNAKIDVWDQNFNLVSKSFSDPSIPSGFAPFNIRLLNGQLYVTYAKQMAPDNHDDQAGLGNGYVDIFNTDGSFVKRFASQGALNSPWGLEIQHSPGNSNKGDILVGNFGDGHINIYDANGKSKGQLMSRGKVIQIDGLWAISYPPQNNQAYASASNWLYFTAGPDDESHSIFGYIQQ